MPMLSNELEDFENCAKLSVQWPRFAKGPFINYVRVEDRWVVRLYLVKPLLSTTQHVDGHSTKLEKYMETIIMALLYIL